ncbi:MAG: hypothetical protein PHV47_00895 [Candidatus Pacebacteria bacterium]|nr:hypothetical protein [Candidatus Paceibacterota bacterium]
MNYDKLFGYILLLLGIAIIVLTLLYSFKIFTGKISAPDIFKKDIAISQNEIIEQKDLNQENIQDYVSQTVQNSIEKVLPENFTNKVINLACWGAFAGLAIFAGGKIGNLGINLITKSKKEEPKEG